MRFGIICLPRSVAGCVADAQLAEAVGFSLVGIADSQSVYRELYATAALCGQATARVLIGPTVTNPVTRHPAVTASAVATLDEITGGRAIVGIGSGDSAILNLGERPVSLATMRSYIETVRALLADHEAMYDGKRLRLVWPARRVPIYLSAEGPKTLALAGEVADGVIVNLGLQPEYLRAAVEQIHAGARRAGRDPASIDIWALVRVNVCSDIAAGLDEIKMELASNAHHVFRFTFEGKGVPPDMVDAIRRVQRAYQPAQHEQLGGPNAAIVDDPVLLRYLAERFAIVGPPEACAEALQRVAAAGVTNVLFTGFVHDRQRLIRTLGEQVLPQVA